MAKFTQEIYRPRGSRGAGSVARGGGIPVASPSGSYGASGGGGGGGAGQYIGQVQADLTDINQEFINNMQKAGTFANMSTTFNTLAAQLGKVRVDYENKTKAQKDLADTLEAVAGTRQALVVERDVYEGVSDGSIDDLNKLFAETDRLYAAAQSTPNEKLARSLAQRAQAMESRWAEQLNTRSEKKRLSGIQAESSSLLLGITENITGLTTESATQALATARQTWELTGAPIEGFDKQAIGTLIQFASANAGTPEGDRAAELLDELEGSGALTVTDPADVAAVMNFRASYDDMADTVYQRFEQAAERAADKKEQDAYLGVYADLALTDTPEEAQAIVSQWSEPSGFQALRTQVGDANAVKLLDHARKILDNQLRVDTPSYQTAQRESNAAENAYMLRLQRYGERVTIEQLEADGRLQPDSIMRLLDANDKVQRNLNKAVQPAVDFGLQEVISRIPGEAGPSGLVVMTGDGPKLHPDFYPQAYGELQRAATAALLANSNANSPEEVAQQATAIREAVTATVQKLMIQAKSYAAPMVPYAPDSIKRGLFTAATQENKQPVRGWGSVTGPQWNTEYYQTLPGQAKLQANRILRTEAADIMVSAIQERHRRQLLDAEMRAQVPTWTEGLKAVIAEETDSNTPAVRPRQRPTLRDVITRQAEIAAQEE